MTWGAAAPLRWGMTVPVRRRLSGSFVFFGARFPAVVVWLAGGILVGSCLAALDYRVGFKLLRFVTFEPDLVLKGEVWRLLTWSFFELRSPLALILGCLALLIFGRDLADAWGPKRFMVAYLVMTAATAVVTMLVAFAWRDVMGSVYLTHLPLVESVIIAYAIWFPARQVLVYFIVPLSGRNLILATLAGTLVFALLQSISLYVPHFIAEGLTLAYLRVPAVGRLWQRLTLGMRGVSKRRPTHLRAVDRLDREDEPPRWLH